MADGTSGRRFGPAIPFVAVFRGIDRDAMGPMKSTGAIQVIRALHREGVDTIFGYPGGAIMPVYDALLDSDIRHILVRHEQAAALAADGYARASGRVGVCLATSGPGATNLVTGIANAFLDSVPIVAITGQVATPFMGTDAFQEVDVLGITMPVVKHSFIIRDAADAAATVHEAFRIAREGRPGPVLIDIPKDVQSSETTPAPMPVPAATAPSLPDPAVIANASRLLAAAAQPVLYAGGGIGMAGAIEAFRRFASATGIPVVTTLKGIGALPGDDEQCLGMLGMHGHKAANLAVQESDLLICVGARFDDRATGRLSGFAPHARIIHLDADASEIGKLREADIGIVGDLSSALDQLSGSPDINAWRTRCSSNRRRHQPRYDAPGDGVYAPAMLRQLSDTGGDKLVVACDVGQHQMWVAQHCRFNRPEQHLSSGGLGTMGFGLPAAIGARLSRPEANVVCVSGDGSIMMNIQELATLRRYDIAVKILLLDNQALGMVRQWQDLFFDNRLSEVELNDNPDFVKVANSFGIPAFSVRTRDQVPDAIARLLAADGPLLAHVCIDPGANVWPLVPPGHSNSTMLEERPQ